MKICLVLLILAATPSFAYTTLGAPDCGKWLEDSRETRKAWLLGYLSGQAVRHEMHERVATDPLDQISSANQVYVWIDGYCKDNPLSTVEEGGQILFDQLIQKREINERRLP